MNQQLCDPNRLSSFVRGELSPDGERELTSHLDQCEACGKALEQQVAEASAWHEASEFLGDRGYQAQGADFSVSETRDLQVQQVLSQLLPTDDPESLGRIGGYEVTGVVGSGGMGVVLKAQDQSLDRVVAVKVPDVYRSPLDQGNSTYTSYFGVVSDDISKRAAELAEMRDQAESGPDAEYAGEYGNDEPQPRYEQFTPEATVFWKQRGASFIRANRQKTYQLLQLFFLWPFCQSK